jgi:hypothetical protein
LRRKRAKKEEKKNIEDAEQRDKTRQENRIAQERKQAREADKTNLEQLSTAVHWPFAPVPSYPSLQPQVKVKPEFLVQGALASQGF